mmetsp:Transcript_150514/g.483883  ORF Transcript_150514/g.483883 Transcript_150514/m.483883 type:complete len:318 (-) Transcript_150514:668-1621(-)
MPVSMRQPTRSCTTEWCVSTLDALSVHTLCDVSGRDSFESATGEQGREPPALSTSSALPPLAELLASSSSAFAPRAAAWIRTLVIACACAAAGGASAGGSISAWASRLWARRSSMGWPASARCSIWMRQLTTCDNRSATSTSDAPNRSVFESSKHRPLISVHTTLTLCLAHHDCQGPGFFESKGSCIVTMICKAVPRFARFDVKKPSRSLCAKGPGGDGAEPSLSPAARAPRPPKRAPRVPGKSSPRQRTATRKCSSSLTQTLRPCTASLRKAPRPWGQWRPAPVQRRDIESGASNSKASLAKEASSASVMPPGRGA